MSRHSKIEKLGHIIRHNQSANAHTHTRSRKEEMDSEKFVADKPHAVCIPYLIQSHIKAMLKFSKLLHHKGFHITFVLKLKKERTVARAR